MAWRNFIFRNFGLKVFSLVLAALIWFAIQAQLHTGARFPGNPFRPLETREFHRPITVLASATNRLALRIEPKEVHVKVIGDASTIKKLQAHEIQVFVKLTDAPRLEGSFPIEVILPRDVNLQDLQPSHVSIEPAGAN